MSNSYGRQVVLTLTNKRGSGVIAGDVVIIDTSNNDAFTTSTAGAYTGMVGIAQETIANNATGRVLIAGYAALVNVNASVTRGNFGKTHTVAAQAASAGASRIVGAFCQFLTGGTTPDAILFGFPDGTTGSAGSPGTPGLTLSTTNSTGSAVTLVATDATIAAFDATVPTTQASGDAAATGSAGTAARRDHKHAMPAAASYPGYELDYAAFTAAVTISATAEATPTDIVTGNAVSYDGATKVMITFSCPNARPGTSVGDLIELFLYDGTTSLGYLVLIRTPGASNDDVPVYQSRQLTPSNASHTYKVGGIKSGGNGTVNAGSGGSGNAMPGYIRITKA